MNEPRRHIRVLRAVVIFSTVLGLGFVFGVAVGFYQLRPVGLVWKVDKLIRGLTAPAEAEARYLRWAFGDPLVEGPLRDPPIRSLDALARQLDELSIVPNAAFFSAYHTITPGRLTSLEGELVELEYSAGDKVAKAYAYLRKPRTDSNCGVLVIPESGDNKSLPTLASNAFGIADVCDTYVLIKPNEGYRAIHDGRYKLRDEMFVVGFLRRGFSYSVTYLVEALALQKYIKNRYDAAGVAGLSQGGEAALLVSLQAKPDFAVIASGFSVVQWHVTMAEIDQIIIPEIYGIYDLDYLRGELSSNGTRYLFTFGERESLYYGVDARTRKSCQFLDAMESGEITCVVHAEAHVMPREVVVPFIAEHQKPRGEVLSPGGSIGR